MQRWAILPVVVLVRTSVIYMTMIIEVSCRFFKVYLTKTHDDIVTQTQGPCSSLQIRTPQEGWNIRDNVLDVKQAHRKDRVVEPALVLGVQDAARVVAESEESGQA